MTNQYRDVLFFVFTSFFILIGLVSISVLLGFPKTADKKFRVWAIRGFVAGITTAIFGLFKLFSLAPTPTIVVTLLPPQGISAPILKSGTYEYDEENAGKVQTRGGQVVPVFTQGGTWEVHLPPEVSSRPTRLKLQDDNGGSWQVLPFYPNYTRQEMSHGRTGAPPSGSAWEPPGVAVVSAAEPGRERSAQEQAAVRFNNFARKIGSQAGRQQYQWRVFVDEPPDMLKRIAQVDYVLHPTFPKPFQSSRDRDKQFELTGSGWGEFTILITVHYTNGKEGKTSYPLNLQKDWPAQTRKPAAANLQVTLEKIRVEWDGSVGPTGWLFDILVDGKRRLQLPKRNYDDGRPSGRNNEFVPDAAHRLVGSLSPANGQAIRIEVKGTRSFGGDTSTGTGMVPATGGAFVVNVTNAGNPRDGSFVFYFSAQPI